MELENLKFRAKVSPDGDWVYGYPIKKGDKWFFFTEGKGSAVQIGAPSTITMFTGKTDKNNNDIYFHDIVHTDVMICIGGNPINKVKEIEIIAEIIYRDSVCFKVLDISEDNHFYRKNGIYPFRNLNNVEIIKERNPNCFKSEKEILMSEIDILRKEKGSLKEEIDKMRHSNGKFSFRNIFKTK